MKALLKFILKILIILCGAFSFYMFFKNTLYDNADTYYTAKDLAFGKIVSESTVLGQTTTLKLNQSYMIMAAYCLPLVGAILAFLMIFFKGRIVGFLFSLISFAFFVVAFVAFLYFAVSHFYYYMHYIETMIFDLDYFAYPFV